MGNWSNKNIEGSKITMNKFRILVVDDNYSKVELVGQVINRTLDCEIDYSNTTNEALRKIRDKIYDIVVVDMNLPQMIGDAPSLSNGAELIEAIYRNNKINKPFCLIGATSHKDAYEKNYEKLIKYGIPLVMTAESNDNLKALLSNKIGYYQHVKESITANSNANNNPTDMSYPEKVTVAWLLKHVDWKHWIGAVTVLVAAFSLGVKASGTTFVKQMYGISGENTAVNQKAKPPESKP